MRGRRSLDPFWFNAQANRCRNATEMNIERFGLMDVARPKEIDVPVRECLLAGQHLDGELNHPVGKQFEALTALERVKKRGRLTEFRYVLRNHTQLHRLTPGLKLLFAPVRRHATQDVLKIQSGKRIDEEVRCAARTAQTCQTAVAGLVVVQHFIIHRGIIHHDCLNARPLQDDVWLLWVCVLDGWIRERRLRTWLCRDGNRGDPHQNQ
ncbi:MAG: hypothetical protein LC114_07270 [Bryobacterales bacterium]|nr:hypothetical protein [Bryobacterales bacterium]